MSATPLPAEPHSAVLLNALAGPPPFAGLTGPVLQAIGDIAEEKFYRAGEALFTPGQFDGGEFFLVCEGGLKAAYPDPASGSMLIEEIAAGEFFGLAEAVVGGENPAAENLTLTAETDVRLIAVDAAAFRAVVGQRPSLTRALMLHFASGLANGGAQSAPDAGAPERRVFAALLEFVERDAVSGAWRIERMPKHRELAEQAGADESVAANAIAKLIQDGVAHRDYPGLVIGDMTRLTQLAS